jgi:hypothetical protein
VPFGTIWPIHPTGSPAAIPEHFRVWYSIAVEFIVVSFLLFFFCVAGFGVQLRHLSRKRYLM